MGKKLLTTKIKVFNENFQNFEKQFKEKIFCNFLWSDDIAQPSL